MRADETVLTRFNTTSDQGQAYPCLVTLGLLPSSMRMRPIGYELVALLPRLLVRLHKGTGTNTLADINRQLTWMTMNKVLEPLDDMHISDLGYACVL